jgi:hypothetical protein
MREKIGLIAGIGLGTGLMFFLDPARGRQRRALVRERARRTSKQLGRIAKSVDRTAHEFAKSTNDLTRHVFLLKRKALRLVA